MNRGKEEENGGRWIIEREDEQLNNKSLKS